MRFYKMWLFCDYKLKTSSTESKRKKNPISKVHVALVSYFLYSIVFLNYFKKANRIFFYAHILLSKFIYLLLVVLFYKV